eukprot:4733150-Pyramimonas_sp.AAC.1
MVRAARCGRRARTISVVTSGGRWRRRRGAAKQRRRGSGEFGRRPRVARGRPPLQRRECEDANPPRPAEPQM